MNTNLEYITSVGKKFKVLYIEDQEDVRQQTKKILENFFGHIHLAKNGEEGLDKFKKNSFDIIFTDLEMPIMNGIDMIKNIRSIDKNIPIVIFSAYSDTEYFIQTINLDINGYILKPYDFDKIAKVIENIISKIEKNIKTTDEIYLVNDFIWNKKNKTLEKNGQIIKLTKNEIKLFEILACFINGFTSNSNINFYVFGDYTDDTKKIRNLISRLRKKLDKDIIESSYSNGYRLKVK